MVSALGGGNQQLRFSQVKLEMPVGASVGGGVQVRGLVKKSGVPGRFQGSGHIAFHGLYDVIGRKKYIILRSLRIKPIK